MPSVKLKFDGPKRVNKGGVIYIAGVTHGNIPYEAAKALEGDERFEVTGLEEAEQAYLAEHGSAYVPPSVLKDLIREAALDMPIEEENFTPDGRIAAAGISARLNGREVTQEEVDAALGVETPVIKIADTNTVVSDQGNLEIVGDEVDAVVDAAAKDEATQADDGKVKDAPEPQKSGADVPSALKDPNATQENVVTAPAVAQIPATTPLKDVKVVPAEAPKAGKPHAKIKLPKQSTEKGDISGADLKPTAPELTPEDTTDAVEV